MKPRMKKQNKKSLSKMVKRWSSWTSTTQMHPSNPPIKLKKSSTK